MMTSEPSLCSGPSSVSSSVGAVSRAAAATAVRGGRRSVLLDHIAALAVAVHTIKTSTNAPATPPATENVHKILQALKETCDFNVLSARLSQRNDEGAYTRRNVRQFLVDLVWLLEWKSFTHGGGGSSSSSKSSSSVASVAEESAEPKPPPSTAAAAAAHNLWAVVAILTKLCHTLPFAGRFLRDRLDLASVLAPILSSLPPTQPSRAAKLLQLLRQVSYGMVVTRREAYLPKLVQTLLNFVAAAGRKMEDGLASQSLFVLASVCRGGNGLTADLIGEQLSDEQRKNLFATDNMDFRIQVMVYQLNYCLSRRNLSMSSRRITDSVESETGFISKICDAFCAAYAEEDCLQMRLFADFLADLRSDDVYRPMLRTEMSLQTIQQILLVIDYSEGVSAEATTLLFAFLRRLLPLLPDHGWVAFDLVAKTVQLRLESSVASDVSSSESVASAEAVAWFADVLRQIAADDQQDRVEEKTQKNVCLQTGPLVSKLCALLSSAAAAERAAAAAAAAAAEDYAPQNGGNARLVGAVLNVLNAAADVHFLRELIPAHLEASHLTSLLSALSGSPLQRVAGRPDEVRARGLQRDVALAGRDTPLLAAAAAALKLCKTFAGESEGWQAAYDGLVSDPSLASWLMAAAAAGSKDVDRFDSKSAGEALHIVLTMASEHPLLALSTPPSTASSFQPRGWSASMSSAATFTSVIQWDGCATFAHDDLLEESGRSADAVALRQTDMKRIETVLDDVTKAVNKLQLDNVSEVLELNEVRLLSQRQQLDQLQRALEAADRRVAAQKRENYHLQTENGELGRFLLRNEEKLQVVWRELTDVRRQYETLLDEVNESRSKAKTDMEEKSATIANLEDKRNKLSNNCIKYKEENESLQHKIKQCQDANDELQGKLKVEKKTVSDLTLLESKLEGKLKKNQTKLEDEQSQRERLEKEFEDAKKKMSSQETLIKRQEQAIAKKDKQLQEQTDELAESRRIQDAIFNLSKNKKGKENRGSNVD